MKRKLLFTTCLTIIFVYSYAQKEYYTGNFFLTPPRTYKSTNDTVSGYAYFSIDSFKLVFMTRSNKDFNIVIATGIWDIINTAYNPKAVLIFENGRNDTIEYHTVSVSGTNFPMFSLGNNTFSYNFIRTISQEN